MEIASLALSLENGGCRIYNTVSMFMLRKVKRRYQNINPKVENKSCKKFGKICIKSTSLFDKIRQLTFLMLM